MCVIDCQSDPSISPINVLVDRDNPTFYPGPDIL